MNDSLFGVYRFINLRAALPPAFHVYIVGNMFRAALCLPQLLKCDSNLASLSDTHNKKVQISAIHASLSTIHSSRDRLRP